MTSFKRIVEKTWLAAFLVIAVVFVISYFKDDAHKIRKIFDADIRVLGFAAVAQIAYFLATATSWQKVLLTVTGRAVAFRESLAQILLVNFGKYIPGKVWGMAARGKRLAESGFGVDEITRASYLEQILLLLTGFGLAFLAAAIVFGHPLFWVGALASVAGIVLLRRGDKLIENLAQYVPRAERLLRYFQVKTSTPRVLVLASGYILVWLFLSGAFALVCSSVVDIQLTALNAAVFVLSLAAGFLAGFLALFAPGGVGVREGVGAMFLATIMSLEDAVLLMLLFRVWVVLAEIVAGAVVLALPGARDLSTGSSGGR